MNFLAHTFLSCLDEDLLIGNFMADFISREEVKNLAPNYQEGIKLHQKIDAYTDQHEAVKRAISILRPSQAKYAPVTCDIVFDYFLTINWNQYSNENIIKFTEKIYTILQNKSATYPQKLRDLLPKMIKDDFLLSCKNPERLQITFERVKKRAKFENNFHKATEIMLLHHDDLDNCFKAFFPDLMTYVGDYCTCN